ncbi:MAG: hypothetical protein KAU29_06440 [Gammaproteobacteria bacterium]|nr:hypothetical protein [Gammaproteobacteria bacterium]
MNDIKSRAILLVLFFLLCLGSASVSWASTDTSSKENSIDEQNNSSVMQAFTSTEVKDSEIVAIEDETKRLVMFFLGVPLLIMLIATVALGIAMGIYGKQVFLPHMICAGLSMTLALGHAVVGIVWFYPF